MVNSITLSSISNILHYPRQQFGYNLTLKTDDGDKSDETKSFLNVMSPHPGKTASVTLYKKSPSMAAFVKTLYDFDLTACSMDDSKKHIQLCDIGLQPQMLAIQKMHIADKAIAEWHAREFERYQERRRVMGLPLLQSRSQRSHWDEEMRLAYIKKFDGTAYQKQRVKDIEEQQLDFKKIEEDAWAEVHARLADNVLDCALESVRVTDIASDSPAFDRFLHTVLSFYLQDCLRCVITDASSGSEWVLEGGMFSRVPVSLHCSLTDLKYLPRATTSKAAQRFSSMSHLTTHPSLLELHEIALSDTDIEIATRRFYSGCTFIQYVFNGPSDIASNSTAIAYACNSDIDGEAVTATNGGRPVLFVLVQIILNLTMERVQAPDSRHTADIYAFFNDLWRDYVLRFTPFLDPRTYTFKGKTVTQYTELFKTLVIQLFDDPSAFIITS